LSREVLGRLRERFFLNFAEEGGLGEELNSFQMSEKIFEETMSG
jgi:hypothetical protein